MAEPAWSSLIPDDAEFMILTDQPSPWVMLMCVTCNRMLLAATHLEPWDWLRKAQDHYGKCSGTPQ